jgi:hypothetical protein
MGCEYGMLALPEPSETPVPEVRGTRVPKVSLQAAGLVALKRNHPVAAARFGFPEPFSVALVAVTGVAASVVAVGAEAVVKERTAAKAVPSLLETMAQK